MFCDKMKQHDTLLKYNEFISPWKSEQEATFKHYVILSQNSVHCQTAQLQCQ